MIFRILSFFLFFSCSPFFFTIFDFPLRTSKHAIIDLTVRSRIAVDGEEGNEDEDADDMIMYN